MEANEHVEASSISALTDEILAVRSNEWLEISSISALDEIKALTEEIQAMKVNEQAEYSNICTLIGFVATVAIVFLALNLLVLLN